MHDRGRLDRARGGSVFRSEDRSIPERPAYFIELSIRDGRVEEIKDVRYVPYIGLDARVVLSGEASALRA